MTTTPLTPPATEAERTPLGRRFAALFTASTLSNLADGIMVVGVPLVALTLTSSPLALSTLSAALWLPWLLLALYAGVVIDRGDRRRILLAALALRLVVLIAATTATFTGLLSLPLLVVLLLAFGITEVFADLASATMVPAVAPKSRLSAANGRLLGAQQVANAFLGAPLAGVLVAVGACWVFGAPAALCVAALTVVLFGLRGAYRSTTPEPESASAADLRLRRQVGEGLRFLLRHRVMRPLTIAAALGNMANTAYFAVFVLWVVGPNSTVQMAPEHFGLLMTALASGAVVGSLIAERLVRRFGEIRLYACLWTTNSLLLIVPVVAPTPWAIAAAFVAIGLTGTCANVISMTLRQRLVPDRLLGRVGGATRTVGYGTMPIGALLGGVIAEFFGLPVLFIGAALLAAAPMIHILLRVTPQMVADAEAEVSGDAPATAAG